MKAKKILYITQEIDPYVTNTPKATVGRKLPQSIQECGHEIRTFTPKWGNINERRNQLHEVIRLSGMNMIIDETDHPLIIKVASLPAARMQIYFIDNDDYFMKRGMTTDENGVEYDDNGERAVFYVRGVLETVKKLRWVPDVIHCHGWIAALAPYYIKKAYAEEPSFQDSKVVCSLSAAEFQNDLGRHAVSCLPYRDSKLQDVNDIVADKFTYTELAKIAIKFSDGIVFEGEDIDPEIRKYAEERGVLTLEPGSADNVYKTEYSDFYEKIMDVE